MGEKVVGYSVFKIDKNVDAGDLNYQDSFNLNQDTYASDVYEKVITLFNRSYLQISEKLQDCLLYTSPSPRDGLLSRMPSSA